MKFEPVFEVSEYYDGPRCGVAALDGKPYEFRSRYLDATEYRGSFRSVDLFDLVPVETQQATTTILAVAVFHPVPNQAPPPSGELRRFEVSWRVVTP